MNSETLKEYLVKIGWNVDESGFKKASGKLKSFVSEIVDKTGAVGKGFIGSFSIVLGVLKTVNEAMLSVVNTTASLDLEEEKLARQYWISEEAARSYSTALEALGESHADILNMTDEQYRRLVELNNLGKSLEAPKEVNDFLLLVRDVRFEFSKLKVELSYLTRWVTYYIGKFLGPDVQKIKQDLKNANSWLQKNIPVIAEKVARFFEVFYRLGKAAFQVAKGLFEVLKWIFELFNNELGKTTGLIGSLFLLISSGPIGWFIAALSTLLLLIDDYMTWQRGGAAAFDWGKIDGNFTELQDNFNSIKESLGEIFNNLSDIFSFVDVNMIIFETFKTVVEGIESFTSLIADDFERISDVIDAIASGDLSELVDWSDFGDWFSERTEDLAKFYNNPIVKNILPNTTGIGDAFEGMNKIYKFFSGSSGGTTRNERGFSGSSRTFTSNTNFNGTVSFVVNSPEEANDYYSGFMERLNQKVPVV